MRGSDDVDQRRAELLELGQRGVDRARDVGARGRRRRTPSARRCAGPSSGCARASRAKSSRVEVLRRRRALVESRASKPLIADSSSAQSSARARHRAGLVEARRERDHAVARAHAVGRLDAGDAGEARRLADRAAGVGAGGGRREARGDRRGRAARRAARHARRVPRVLAPAPKAEFSFDEPIANSSQLSLPSVTMPAAAEALRRRSRRTGCGSRRASSSRRWCGSRAVTKMSLCAIGTPSSGAGVAGARCARRRRAPAPASASASTREEGVQRRSCAAQRGRADAASASTLETSLRVRSARRRAAATLDGRARLRAHSITFGTRNRPSSTAGALRWLVVALVRSR